MARSRNARTIHRGVGELDDKDGLHVQPGVGGRETAGDGVTKPAATGEYRDAAIAEITSPA